MLKMNRVFLIMMVSLLFLTGCASKEKTVDDERENKPEENNSLSITTGISYSSGEEVNWVYGNQRKEFPDNKNCYVRIASKAITEKNRYSDLPIEVKYRFIGSEKCEVSISEGVVESVDTGDSNITEFTHTLYACKKNESKDDVVVFQYLPDGAERIMLEVIYDDQVEQRYDARNEVYFKKQEEIFSQNEGAQGEVDLEEKSDEDNSIEKKEKGVN